MRRRVPATFQSSQSMGRPIQIKRNSAEINEGPLKRGPSLKLHTPKPCKAVEFTGKRSSPYRIRLSGPVAVVREGWFRFGGNGPAEEWISYYSTILEIVTEKVDMKISKSSETNTS